MKEDRKVVVELRRGQHYMIHIRLQDGPSFITPVSQPRGAPDKDSKQK